MKHVGVRTWACRNIVVTSYPPLGIATYSQDLIRAINNKFSNSISIKVCALELMKQITPILGKSNISLNLTADEYEKLTIAIKK